MIKGPHEVREGEKRKPGRNFSLIPCIAILVESGTNYDVKNPLGNFWIEENKHRVESDWYCCNAQHILCCTSFSMIFCLSSHSLWVQACCGSIPGLWICHESILSWAAPLAPWNLLSVIFTIIFAINLFFLRFKFHGLLCFLVLMNTPNLLSWYFWPIPSQEVFSIYQKYVWTRFSYPVPIGSF